MYTLAYFNPILEYKMASIQECEMTCVTVESSVKYIDGGGGWTATEDKTQSTNLNHVPFNDTTLPTDIFATVALDNGAKTIPMVWEWANVVNGSQMDYGTALSTDACSNTYVTGLYNSSLLTFTNANNSFAFTLTSNSSNNLLVSKMDTDGSWKWAAYIEGIFQDPVIATDCSGNTYIATHFESNMITLHNANNTIHSVFSNYGTNPDPILIVAKITSNGNWSWLASMDDTSTQKTTAIAVTNCGKIYIATTYEDNPTELYHSDGSASGLTISNFGTNVNILVAQLSDGGYWKWVAAVGGDNNDQYCAIALDCCGNAYISGEYNNASTQLTFYNSDLSNTINGPSSVSSDLFVAKINSDGFWQWVSTVNGTINVFNGWIGVDACQQVYIACSFEGTGTFTSDRNTLMFDSYDSTLADYVIASMDDHGTWTNISSVGPIDTIGHRKISLVVDGVGNSYVTGTFHRETITFSNSDSTVFQSLTSVGATNVNGDMFLALLDKNGMWKSVIYVSGVGQENLSVLPTNEIAMDCHENLYITGVTTSSSLTFYNQNNETAFTLVGDHSSGALFSAKITNAIPLLGITESNDCIKFKSTLRVTASHMNAGDYPLIIGKRYYYDKIANILTSTCPQLGCCTKCVCSLCEMTIKDGTLFGIGAGPSHIYVL